MTGIKYKERPTPEQVAKYENKLNYCLQELKAKVKVVLYDLPHYSETYINGTLVDAINRWIDYLLIETPEGKLKVERIPLREGIDDTVTNQEIWLDAYSLVFEIHRCFHPGKEMPMSHLPKLTE